MGPRLQGVAGLFRHRSGSIRLVVGMVVPIRLPQRLGAHAEIARSLIKVRPCLHLPRRRGVARDVRAILAPLLPASSRDRLPRIPEFLHRRALIVNDGRNAFREVGLSPPPQVRQQPGMDTSRRLPFPRATGSRPTTMQDSTLKIEPSGPRRRKPHQLQNRAGPCAGVHANQEQARNVAVCANSCARHVSGRRPRLA